MLRAPLIARKCTNKTMGLVLRRFYPEQTKLSLAGGLVFENTKQSTKCAFHLIDLHTFVRSTTHRPTTQKTPAQQSNNMQFIVVSMRETGKKPAGVRNRCVRKPCSVLCKRADSYFCCFFFAELDMIELVHEVGNMPVLINVCYCSIGCWFRRRRLSVLCITRPGPVPLFVELLGILLCSMEAGTSGPFVYVHFQRFRAISNNIIVAACRVIVHLVKLQGS